MADGTAPSFHDALAGELEAVKASLEEAAVSLCLDPMVFERHAESLQCFDRLAQVIAEIAGLLRSRAEPEVAMGAIRLEALRNRLTATSATAQ